jgi:hypothetical protein
MYMRGWQYWLVGNPPTQFHASVLELRFGAFWTHVPATTPAGALGCVLVICLDNPPWEDDEDDLRWLLTEE